MVSPPPMALYVVIGFITLRSPENLVEIRVFVAKVAEQEMYRYGSKRNNQSFENNAAKNGTEYFQNKD